MISEVLAQTVVNVLMLSSIYILVALGFALLLTVLGILNFTHASVYMVGGYICYELAVVAGFNQWADTTLPGLVNTSQKTSR